MMEAQNADNTSVNMTYVDTENPSTGHKVTLFVTCMAMYSIALALSSAFLFLLILLRDEIRKIHTTWYVLSGVFGLFLTATIWLPLSLTNFTDWSLGMAGCHVVQVVYHLLKIQLSLTMVAIAIDRCLFLYDSKAYHKSPSGRFTLGLIAACWIIAMILAITLTYGISVPKVVQHRGAIHVCVSSPRGGSTSRLASLIIEHFLPWTLNVIFAICLCCCHHKPKGGATGAESHQAGKLVWVPLILFTLTCTPLYSVRLGEAVFSFMLDQAVWSALYVVSELFYGGLLLVWVALTPGVWPALYSVCCCCLKPPPEESKRLIHLK